MSRFHIDGMRNIDAGNAVSYLRETQRIGHQEEATARELTGGVSNVVLYVSRAAGAGPDLVIKQAREQLRVAQPWFCAVERIWREMDGLRAAAAILRRAGAGMPTSRSYAAGVPEVLFEDRGNFLFAMAAAPPSHLVWKRALLAGEASVDVAAACGQLLGTLHGGSWCDRELAEQFGDLSFFEQLRVDPYYRQLARVHPDLQPRIDQLIESVLGLSRALVHGDFSPKNMLLWDRQLWLVDFEVVCFGDPAFDVGFFLSHLFLKSFHVTRCSGRFVPLVDTFWDHYSQRLSAILMPEEWQALMARSLFHLGGCLLARVDGKSPVEYLTDPVVRERVRRFARVWLFETPHGWPEARERWVEELEVFRTSSV